MERADLKELHYITPIANVASILERGILSHISATRIKHDSVADESVQERRSRVQVQGKTRLHHYVNLYLNARNPMLYRLARGEGRTDDLCVGSVPPGGGDLMQSRSQSVRHDSIPTSFDFRYEASA